MIDTHCHLQFPDYDADIDLVIQRMIDSNISKAIVVGTDVESSLKAVMLAERYPNLYASVGIHPTELNLKEFDKDIKELESLLSHKKIVAIGEVGLDYKVYRHRDETPNLSRSFTSDFNEEPNRALQQNCLIRLIKLADQANLPVIIHSRMADDDLLSLIKAHKPTRGGVIHCFDSDYKMAVSVLDLGLHISFTGMLTYPKKDSLRLVASRLPQERVLLETDSPYLPPQSKRGERNEPTNINETSVTLADLWQCDIAHVDHVTSQNARELFGI